MNSCIEPMLELQRLLRSDVLGRKPGAVQQIVELRARIPAPVLAHFDRLIAQGRKGVAEVHHGVCGACHLKLPGAPVAAGLPQDELHLCDHCGAYLVFPPVAPDMEPPSAPSVQRRRRRVAAAPPAVLA